MYYLIGISKENKVYIIEKYILEAAAEEDMLKANIGHGQNDWLEVAVVEVKQVRH